MLAHCHLKILTRRGPSTKETSTPSSSNRLANLISKCAEKKERRQAPTSLRALGVRILFQLRKDEEVNQTTLREQNFALLEIKPPMKWDRLRTKYCPYHQLISHSIEDCFMLKGKIQDLIDSGGISFPKDLVKASLNQVLTKRTRWIQPSPKNRMTRKPAI